MILFELSAVEKKHEFKLKMHEFIGIYFLINIHEWFYLDPEGKWIGIEKHLAVCGRRNGFVWPPYQELK